MVRPSALQIAERCGLAPKLAADFPEQSDAAERGTLIHQEIAAAINDGRHAQSPEARAALEWLKGCDPESPRAEVKLQLIDPEHGDLLTEGTADVVATLGGVPMIIDWKTGRPENVAPLEDNLQMAAYGIAAALNSDADGFHASIVFLDGDTVTPVSATVSDDHMWPMLDRIKRAASREPVASYGDHCARCYQRALCPSYRERTKTALTLLPHDEITQVTDEVATQLVLRARAVREAADLAEQIAKAHVLSGGKVLTETQEWGPQMVAGRRSGPSVKDLEAAGLEHLIREGKPSERWQWRRRAD